MNGPLQPTLARAFRRAALPLGWYYLVTLGLPLANGAAQSGAAFVNHAVVVIVVPPILIMLLSTIRKTAQVFAATCRSALGSWFLARPSTSASSKSESRYRDQFARDVCGFAFPVQKGQLQLRYRRDTYRQGR